VPAPRARGQVSMGLTGMVGSSAPFKNFDPLGFAAKADAATLAKYRESELKHGEWPGVGRGGGGDS
jgi:hypothetical protein